MRSILVALALLVAAAPSAAQNVGSPLVLANCQDIWVDSTTDVDYSGVIPVSGQTPSLIPVLLAKYRPQSLSAVAYCSPVSGTTPTLDLKVQSCESTTTTTCSDVFTFDQCTTGTCYGGDNMQVIDLNESVANVFKYFRVVVDVGGTTPVYNCRVKLCAD